MTSKCMEMAQGCEQKRQTFDPDQFIAEEDISSLVLSGSKICLNQAVNQGSIYFLWVN